MSSITPTMEKDDIKYQINKEYAVIYVRVGLEWKKLINKGCPQVPIRPFRRYTADQMGEAVVCKIIELLQFTTAKTLHSDIGLWVIQRDNIQVETLEVKILRTAYNKIIHGTNILHEYFDMVTEDDENETDESSASEDTDTITDLELDMFVEKTKFLYENGYKLQVMPTDSNINFVIGRKGEEVRQKFDVGNPVTKSQLTATRCFRQMYTQTGCLKKMCDVIDDESDYSAIVVACFVEIVQQLT